MRFVKPGAAAVIGGAEPGGSSSHSGAGADADGSCLHAGAGSGPKTGARIAVRHVQSGYERRFVDLDDAMDFIREEIRLLEQD
jgi:hypothetical protein